MQKFARRYQVDFDVHHHVRGAAPVQQVSSFNFHLALVL